MGLLDFISPGQKNRTAQAGASTQTHLRIGEIRDGVLILKNGGVRAVLETSSINFNLKSEDEQNAIIYSYQGFLNSLEFPIQILIRSKKLDIDNYIDQVYELSDKQENKLLQEQTVEYAQYIKRLVEYSDIMEKKFFVIVPYDPPRTQSAGKLQSFFQRLSPKDSYSDIKRRRAEFNELKKSLFQRVNIVQSGLEGCGLSVKSLDTLELINLFYESYNPKTSREQKLKDLENTSIETEEEKINNEEHQQELESKELEKRKKNAEASAKTPEVVPASAPEAKTPETVPASTPEAKTPETAPASAPEAKTPEVVQASAPETKTPETVPASTPETKTPETPQEPTLEPISSEPKESKIMDEVPI